MRLYLKRRNSEVDAVAEYDVESKVFVVLKGSRVSANIAHSEKFRGAKSIEKARAEYVKDCKVIKDAVFKSSSTAANFVTGTSTNGLMVWKNEEGIKLKQLISEGEIDE